MNTKMVFATLRILLGAADKGVDIIWEQVIKDNLYPMIDSETKEEIQKKLDNGEMEKIVNWIAHEYTQKVTPNIYTQDELISDFIEVLMKRIHGFIKYFNSNFTFKNLKNLFIDFCKKEMAVLLKKAFVEKSKYKSLDKPIDDEKNTIKDFFENPKSINSPMEKEDMQHVKRDLFEYVARVSKKGKQDLNYVLLKVLWEKIQQTGLGNKIVFNDIYADPRIQEFGHNRNDTENRFRDLKKLIVKFFEDEYDVNLSKRFKEKMYIKSSEQSYFRRIFATYMIGCLNKFQKPEEFAVNMANKFNGEEFEVKVSSELVKIAKLLK